MNSRTRRGRDNADSYTSGLHKCSTAYCRIEDRGLMLLWILMRRPDGLRKVVREKVATVWRHVPSLPRVEL